MQQQPYGFSNNPDQPQTQQIPQQGYQNYPYNNNYNNNGVFVAPQGQPYQSFPQNQYNMPVTYPQTYNQGYNQPPVQYDNQGYNQPPVQYDINIYQTPQNQYNNHWSAPQPYNSNNNDDYPPPPRPRETVEPNNINLGLDQQDRLDHDEADKWNQPDQVNAPKQEKTTPKPQKQGSSLGNFRRSMSSWGKSDRLGTFMSLCGLGSVPVLLAVIIALMVYHFASKPVRLTSIAGGLNYMAFNLNSHPILDLKLSGGICPIGYEMVHLGIWPGVSNGCSCPLTGETLGSCTDKEDIICTDVSDIDPIDMYKWEGSIFCVKRAQLGTEYIKAPSCPTGYEPCSAGICLKTGMACPITSISVKSTNVDADVFLGWNKWLKFSRDVGKAPMIDIDISLNDIPCFSNTEIPKGKGDYTLLKVRPNGCLTYGIDNLFSKKIDEVTQMVALTANNFPREVIDLPHYKKVLEATPTVLSGRNRITVANNPQCLGLDTQMMTHAGTAASDLNRYISGTAITAMVLHAILFFMIFGALADLRKKYDWKEIFSGSGAGLWLCGYGLLGFCELIVFIVMVGLARGARADLVAAKEYLVGLDQMGCFPEGPPQQVIADYDNAVDEVASTLNGYATALLALSIISYVPVMSITAYKKWRK